jgi:hypothetical protein
MSRKFAHADVVKVIETGETGIVKSFQQDETGFVYGVQLGGGPATETAVPEDALELVKIANDDETGFAVRPCAACRSCAHIGCRRLFLRFGIAVGWRFLNSCS